MDIFAHGLWAAAAARTANRRRPRRIRIGWAAWWGVFPDLFAFTVPIVLLIWLQVTGAVPAGAPHGPQGMPHLGLAWQLYQISHSLFVFGAVFGLAWLVLRRPAFELLGWALHILIDIPTHSLRFFATPFLWPVSSYRFDGISWGVRWFMITNYSSLAAAYLLLWWTGRRRRNLPEPVYTEGD
jgi:hypothetical protein